MVTDTHTDVCDVHKKQKAWQKQKTGLEKEANKQQYFQDTNTLDEHTTVRRIPDRLSSSPPTFVLQMCKESTFKVKKARKSRPDNTNVTVTIRHLSL